MSRSYEDYVLAREARLSLDGLIAMQIFDQVHIRYKQEPEPKK